MAILFTENSDYTSASCRRVLDLLERKNHLKLRIIETPGWKFYYEFVGLAGYLGGESVIASTSLDNLTGALFDLRADAYQDAVCSALDMLTAARPYSVMTRLSTSRAAASSRPMRRAKE